MSIPRWVAVDDADSRIQYIGSGWFQDQGSQNDRGNFGASYKSTLHGTKSNASLSFTFSGAQVKVLGFNNIRNDSGVIDPSWECFVDNISIGQSKPSIAVDNYWTMCDHDQLVDGQHVITVNATVMKEQTFWVDQIRYVPSSYVPLDTAAVVVDNTDPAITFGDGWSNLGNFCNATNAANSIVTFPFNGASVSWYAFIPETPHTPTTGSYSVDGGPPSNFILNGIPINSPVKIEYNQKLFETPQYDPGPHTLVVTYLGNSSATPLTLDWLIVQNATATRSSNGSSTTQGGSDVPSSKHTKNVGPIVGGVIGTVVLIGIAVCAILYFRRWERNQKKKPILVKEAQLGADDNMAIVPFQLSPSLQTGASGSFYANHRPQGSITTFTTTRHGPKPSQSTVDLKSTTPPSLTSRSRTPIPTPSGSQGRSVSPYEGNLANSTRSDPLLSARNYQSPPPIQQPIGSEKERREAEATVTALRPQRFPVRPPLEPPVHSSDSGSSRMIVHEDSGLRLPRVSQGSVLEVPPRYTVG
ncbi:hypothetical protein JR316_0004004 [Psilocybe cubensis]|uniref:Transmembrane protein n=2 Tax=Psilocybe cubensis TaxID=181762 RepID=A0A8H8CNH8_PSICU|nr:hypothetical protein JR316_0004004 [Psilocybe cubensis]KAH9484522.1 hypothetical protein JR316_0004004 [Psilocybe cubensis]